MSVIVSDIKMPMGTPEEEAIERALQILGLTREAVSQAVVHKRTIDARRRAEIKWVYAVSIALPEGEEQLVERLANKDIVYHAVKEITFTQGTKPMGVRPYVVGFGPAGMFAALVLARQGYCPIILERGMPVEQRVEAVEHFWSKGELNPESNVQFGEGGAGTFSDGKLVTRVRDPFHGFVLQELVKHGAPAEIQHQAKPHIGTDLLRGIVRSIREEILALGGEIHFQTQVEDIKTESGKITQIQYHKEWHAAETVILAIGHSARDTFSMLHRNGVSIENKPFSVGVRIEHLQADIDTAQYGAWAGNPLLPAADYQLAYRNQDRGVYTFCMCPGGIVVPSASQTGEIVTNGMSQHARDGKNANSALVVSVDSKDFGTDWDSGIKYQQKLEQSAYQVSGSYQAPAQTVDLFLQGKAGLHLQSVTPSYPLGVVEGDFSKLFSPGIIAMLQTGLRQMSNKIHCFSKPDSVLTGVETRTSSPVRILRGEGRQSQNTENLYPCGEGAGYAGGIISAALDGITTAYTVIAEYAPWKL